MKTSAIYMEHTRMIIMQAFTCTNMTPQSTVQQINIQPATMTCSKYQTQHLQRSCHSKILKLVFQLCQTQQWQYRRFNYKLIRGGGAESDENIWYRFSKNQPSRINLKIQKPKLKTLCVQFGFQKPISTVWGRFSRCLIHNSSSNMIGPIQQSKYFISCHISALLWVTSADN